MDAPMRGSLQGRVLIVDDSGTIADLLRAALLKLGVEEIAWAATAKQGMRLFHELDPDLVFCDIQLPDAGGETVAAQMMATKRSLRLVVVTGLSREDKRVRDTVSLGAFDVLEKPVRVDRLRQLLQLIDAESRNLRRV